MIIQKKDFFIFLFSLFIPNFIFILLAFFTQTSRPLINSDYLLPLFFLIIPYKISRIIGVLLLIISIFVDVLMLTIQIFPFLDLDGILYLSSFIFSAPLIYKTGILLLVIVSIFLIYILLQFTKNISFTASFTIILILVFLTYQNYALQVKYYESRLGLGRDNYYIIYNQTSLLNDILGDGWRKLTVNNKKPVLVPMDKKNNSSKYLTMNSDKVLFIVAESLGAMRSDEQNNEIYKEIIAYKDNLEFFKIFNFDFYGATVAGELRELCSLSIRGGGYNFKNNSFENFKNCIPYKFQNQGFNTIGIHGASSNLYERTNLYEKLGFKERYFSEHFLDKKRCTAFYGICDSELFDFVLEKFKTNDKLFFYWMTLTSHIPYHKKDIFNHRFDCEKFGMKPDGDICRNVKLQTQFFDQLAELIKKDEMKGVEVMVVGDHMPPFITPEKIYPFFKYNEVAVIHFKVKE